jgi:hypothetical protein
MNFSLLRFLDNSCTSPGLIKLLGRPSGLSVGYGFSIELEKIGTFSLDCDILLSPVAGMGITIMPAITTSKV